MRYYSYPETLETPLYRLSLSHGRKQFVIQGLLTNAPLSTASIPSTALILKKFIPQIFTSTCFNDAHLPFKKELENTEVAHLFEHILLEFLCVEKLKYGADKAVFDGITRWYVDEPENFEITITGTTRDLKYYPHAFKLARTIFDLILLSAYSNLRTPYIFQFT